MPQYSTHTDTQQYNYQHLYHYHCNISRFANQQCLTSHRTQMLDEVLREYCGRLSTVAAVSTLNTIRRTRRLHINRSECYWHYIS